MNRVPIDTVWASEQCTQCGGRGVRRRIICGCIYRWCFRTVMARYRRAEWEPKRFRSILFRADVAIAARILSAERLQLWKLHYVQDLEWRPCCQRLHMDRGTFWHEVYRVQESLGRIWLDRGIAPPAKYYDFGPEIHLARPRCTTSMELNEKF